jgi:hypothetical protein
MRYIVLLVDGRAFTTELDCEPWITQRHEDPENYVLTDFEV